jgi:hypothetical protein
MTDLRRLGKRNSYRLGRLRSQGIGDLGPASPGRPSFTRPRHQGATGVWLLAAAAGTALIAGGAVIGLWFAPFAVGLAAGLANAYGGWRARVMIAAVAVMALIGWGVPLAWPAWHGLPAGATARAIAALTGLPAYAAAGVALALAVAVAQGWAGLWLGRALTPRGR